MPPLRDRDEDDLRLLAESFVEELNEQEGENKKLTEEAVEELTEHDWPGNVRELKNTIRRAFILSSGQRITSSEIETAPLRRPEPKDKETPGTSVPRSGEEIRVKVGAPIEAVEKELILATLEECKGDKKRAARILGISFRTLYYRLEKYREEREIEG